MFKKKFPSDFSKKHDKIRYSTIFTTLIAAGLLITDLHALPYGLIGGYSSSGAYAALVGGSGAVTALNGLPLPGSIQSVAMLESLLPLLSQIPTEGLTHNNLHLANYFNQYAPDTAFYFVPSVLNGSLAQALEAAAPTRHAFDLFAADNAFFALSQSFSSHADNSHRYATFQEKHCDEKKRVQRKSKRVRQEPDCGLSRRPFQFWGHVLGAVSYNKSQHQTPSFRPLTGGVILGFEVLGGHHDSYGFGGAYSYTDLHQKQGRGGSKINQEYLFVYGLWNKGSFYGNGALWGGVFQIKNRRHIALTSFDFTATSRPKGWQLAPHVEFGYQKSFSITTIDPFIALDWVNNWQGRYEEKGGGPLNFGQKSHHSSFLRGETGLKVSQAVEFNSWRVIFQEKAAYACRKPFGVGEVQAYLVDSPGSFTVTTLPTPKNVGVAGAKVSFESIDPRFPQGGIAYQGEFGSGYQSHQGSLSLEWNF